VTRIEPHLHVDTKRFVFVQTPDLRAIATMSNRRHWHRDEPNREREGVDRELKLHARTHNHDRDEHGRDRLDRSAH
jgi:hypothetical protein